MTAFKVDRETRVEAVISEDGANMGGFQEMVVMAEHGLGKHGTPIILFVIDMNSGVLFQSGVPAFHVSVCLGMEGGGQFTLYLERLA